MKQYFTVTFTKTTEGTFVETLFIWLTWRRKGCFKLCFELPLDIIHVVVMLCEIDLVLKFFVDAKSFGRKFSPL